MHALFDSLTAPKPTSAIVDLDTLEQRTGLVSTTRGGSISLTRLIELGYDIQTHTIISSKLDGVVAYGRGRRFAPTVTPGHSSPATRAAPGPTATNPPPGPNATS